MVLFTRLYRDAGQQNIRNKHTFYDQLLFPPSKVVQFMRSYGKIWNSRTDHRHQYNTIQYNTEHVLTCRIPKATDTHLECVTLIAIYKIRYKI